MTNKERSALLARIKAAARAAKSMSSEEATRRLIEEGIYGKDGRLSPRYGGKIAARG